MNATAQNQTPENVIPLPTTKPRNRTEAHGTQFKIKTFKNESGTDSFRVDGYKRDGTRVRINYAEYPKAQAKQIELEAEYLQFAQKPEIRATRLTELEIELAESAFVQLGKGNEAELLSAVHYWIAHGRQSTAIYSPKLDEAITKFKDWMEKTGDIRERTKGDYRTRIDIFGNSVPNTRVADIAPETIKKFLDDKASVGSRKNYKKAISRFFSWCAELDRKWVKINPCKAFKVNGGTDDAPPAILTLDECRKLVRAASTYRKGRLMPYVALCLFGGLRPEEAAQIPLAQVNLKDGEVSIHANQSKVKRGRLVKMPDTLRAWLEKFKDKPTYPENWRRDFDVIKARAGYGNKDRLAKKHQKGIGELKEWVPDIMRHTAISHYFRNCGSYGLTAEWAGNSEAIIKKHYQGRVSTEDTAKFYAIMPGKKGSK